MSKEICSVEECVASRYCRGWCTKHYQRWQKHGDPTYTVTVRGGDLDGFWSRVDVGHPLGCWQWSGYVNPTGYAMVQYHGRSVGVHRLSYELLVGPIRDGLVIDHLCRNTGCLNPDHLEPVANAVNILRGYSQSAKNARKERCKRGHELTTRLDGKRHCLICRRELQRERRRKERA